MGSNPHIPTREKVLEEEDIRVKPEKVYACYSKDKDVRLSSSSGAVFSSLAEYVFNRNGSTALPSIAGFLFPENVRIIVCR